MSETAQTTLQPRADAAVIVGRFQVDELHPGHRSLIQSVTGNGYARVAVVLGVAPIPGRDNPLDFLARARMIQAAFPSVAVLPLMDMESNEEWSTALDRLVRAVFPMGKVDLYGGRDSFISLYSGKHRALELHDPTRSGDGPSGTAIRERLAAEVRPSADFRAGMIYQTMAQHPRVFPTVDVAVTRTRLVPPAEEGWEDRPETVTELLLVRKADEHGWRLPGGFVDPSDESYLMAALRELREETGVKPSDLNEPTYAGSFNVKDWRVPKGEAIMTTVFAAHGTVPDPTPGDDAAEARFLPLSEVHTLVAPCHAPILAALFPRKP